MIPPRPRQANRVPPTTADPARRPRLVDLRAVRARFGLVVVVTKFLLVPWLLATWHGRSLRHLCGPARGAPGAGPVVVSTWHGDAPMLAAFLAHHRSLGAAEFVFLDLSASGELDRRLGAEAACAVWRPLAAADMSKSLFWLNYLRRRYGSGRWVLSLEPFDLFVFHRCETRRIGDLLDFLASERRTHVYALVLEMYGDEHAGGLGLAAGESPLDALPFFDPFGYQTSDPGPDRAVAVRGGVQRRTLFADAPRRSPELNRVPLIKWQWFYAYVAGTRLVMPRRLNTPHSPWHSSPTACLLRFALLGAGDCLAEAARAEGREIVRDGGGRSLARVAELRALPLRREWSRRYRDTDDLVACGLLNPGQWF